MGLNFNMSGGLGNHNCRSRTYDVFLFGRRAGENRIKNEGATVPMGLPIMINVEVVCWKRPSGPNVSYSAHLDLSSQARDGEAE